MRIFYSSLHRIFESENFRFPFLYEKLTCLTWAVKCEKLDVRKSQGIY